MAINTPKPHHPWWQVWLRDLYRTLFPDRCLICGRLLVGAERALCLECESRIPRTNYHLHPENELVQRLVCHAPILRAAAMFHYVRQSPYTTLIKRAKYNDHPEIDALLASHYARELLNAGFFADIDLLMPVPMHWRKQMRRGYNQAEVIARAMAKVVDIPVADNLVATRRHSTQTRKGAEQRLANTEGVFHLQHPYELAGRHVCIVDDVITTGSTIIHCAEAIHLASPSTRLSVLALAAAHLQ